MNDASHENLPPEAAFDMETVFVGPPSEVYVVQSALRDLGFLTHIANENIKLLDPFVTGANPLESRLQVPRKDAPGAYRALRELKGGRPDGEALTDSSGDYDPDLLASLDRLSRRIRWAALSVVLAPVAAVLGFLYFARTVPLQTKPAHHGLTLAAIALSLPVGLGIVAMVLHSLVSLLESIAR